MLDTIKIYQEEKTQKVKHISLIKSDDGTLVFFKDCYDQNTGEKLANEVVETITEKEIKDEIIKKQEEIVILQKFLDEITK